MKIFALGGSTAAERTKTAKAIAVELERRHRSVALWLETTPSNDTNIPKPSKTICDNSISFGRGLTLEESLPYIHEEFLIVDQPVYKLPVLSLDENSNALTFGKATDFTDLPTLVDFIERTAPNSMPFVFGNTCCKGCSHGSCQALLEKIIAGKATMEECTVCQPKTRVKVNGSELALVQFGQDIIRRTNQGLLSTLDGYSKNAHIEIEILPED